MYCTQTEYAYLVTDLDVAKIEGSRVSQRGTEGTCSVSASMFVKSLSYLTPAFFCSLSIADDKVNLVDRLLNVWLERARSDTAAAQSVSCVPLSLRISFIPKLTNRPKHP